MSGTSATRAALLALFVSVFGWGLAPVATQFALRGVPAATVLALLTRRGPVPARAATTRARLPTGDWLRLSVAALLGVVGYNAAVTFGLR